MNIFDKRIINNIDYEAKIVEHEIKIKKNQNKQVENSNDGLLNWLTIISDGYLEKYDNKIILVIKNKLRAIDRSKSFEHCQESLEMRHVNRICK
ncbi:25562_t:CDS:1, partial [Gigaspora margarita]